MNVLSLFDGMSCGRLALTKLGVKVDKYYASEIDKYAIKVAQANYPDTVQLGSVTGLQYENGVLFHHQDDNTLQNGGTVDVIVHILNKMLKGETK